MRHPLLIPLAIAAFAAAVPARAQLTRPAEEQALARAIYKEFIEIPSGFTTGSTTPVAQAAAARLRAAGFPEADIHVDGASPKKANLVVRYHGTGARKPLLLLAHTDVVEAKREDWSMDPFQLIEKDGYFYGRGTGDDKAQAAVWIANLIQYRKEGFVPDRDIIVALTADEEGGGPFNGVDWLLKNHRDWIDAEYALNEGGWGDSENGKRIANDLQVSEKYVLGVRLEVRNKGGHSSLPVEDNAIYHLAGALDRLSRFAFPLKTNEVTAAYFKEMAKTETGARKADLEQAAAGSQAAMQRVAKGSVSWNATLRTTCVATMLEGGHAPNALPQLAAATVNCRVLPEDKADDVVATIRKVVADTQVVVTVPVAPEGAPASPLRPDVVQAVTGATQQLWPGVLTVPIMVMGATDGRSLRAAGIPTYGIQGFFFDRDDIRFHGRDERMRVRSFYEGHAFLYDLVKRLARATPASSTHSAALLLDPGNAEWTRPAPAISQLRFETTKGVFVLELHRDWGPIGADRFYNLARLGYYDDTRFHRVRPGYIAQFGLHGDSAVNAAWKGRYIGDDPPRSPNARGTFAFSYEGPGHENTRNTQLYVNLADNVRNDAEPFTVLGTVVEGMAVLDSLYGGYGEDSGSGVRQGKQGPLERGGNAFMDRVYPKLDRIRRVTVQARS